VKEASRVLLFASYASTMKKASLTYFSSALFRRRYGIDGGNPGIIDVFMPLLSLTFGKAWADLQQRPPFYRLPGWLDRLLFSGTFGWKGIIEFFVIKNWIAFSYGRRFLVGFRRLFLQNVICLKA